MEQFKLEPGDILVNIDDGNSPLSLIKRWFVGPYSHVFMYLGEISILVYYNVLLKHPMLFESIGRGVIIRSLRDRYDEKVVVMRLKSEDDRRNIPVVLKEAILLSSGPNSYYDYYSIIGAVLPRIIREKFHLPIPVSYHRDTYQICSEAVNEVYLRGNITLFPFFDIPLPGDFVTESPLLEEVGRIVLSDGVV